MDDKQKVVKSFVDYQNCTVSSDPESQAAR